MTSLPTMQALRVSTPIRWQDAGIARRRINMEPATRRRLVEGIAVILLIGAVMAIGLYAPKNHFGAGSGTGTIQGWQAVPAPYAGTAVWARYYQSQAFGDSYVSPAQAAPSSRMAQPLPTPVPVPAPTPSVQPQVEPTPVV